MKVFANIFFKSLTVLDIIDIPLLLLISYQCLIFLTDHFVLQSNIVSDRKHFPSFLLQAKLIIALRQISNLQDISLKKTLSNNALLSF